MAIPPIGAGSAVAGGGYAGADIPGLSPVVAPISNPEFYVPLARATALNADGSIQTLHPVDQEVIFDLSNKLGSVPNDPTRGLDTDAIRRAPDSRKLLTAQDRVNVCLAKSIANGDITVDDVSLQANPPPGRLGISITYTNLRTKKTAPPVTL
ncbi:MAG TPA: hypothetical protein VGH28_13805 [Polyangiaceae bacterium]|jgi:hypothetical protein